MWKGDGNPGRDAYYGVDGEGKPFAVVGLAAGEKKTKDGVKSTWWLTCWFRGERLANRARAFVKKGRRIWIEGFIEPPRVEENPDGHDGDTRMVQECHVLDFGPASHSRVAYGTFEDAVPENGHSEAVVPEPVLAGKSVKKH